MSNRAEQLAKRLEEASSELARVVEAASDEEWRKSCDGEGWSVGVTAHHIAGGYAPISGFIQAVASGKKLPALPLEALDKANADHAEQAANCTKEETLEVLRGASGPAIQAVRAMSDEQLDISGELIAGTPAMTTQQMAENVLIGHVLGHLESIKGAS